MQRLIKKHATSHNELFDGEGNIAGLAEFVEDYELEEDEFDIDEDEIETMKEFIRLSRGELSLKPIEKLLREYFLSEGDFPIDDDLIGFFATNHLIECTIDTTYKGYKLLMEGIGDGPELCININTFVMNDPARWYECLIKNQFYEFDDYSYLHLELCRIDLDDWNSDL